MTAEQIVELRDLAAAFETAVRAQDSETARGVNYRLHRRKYDFANLPKTLHFVQAPWAQYPFDVINRIPGRALRAARLHGAGRLLRRRRRARERSALPQAIRGDPEQR